MSSAASPPSLPTAAGAGSGARSAAVASSGAVVSAGAGTARVGTTGSRQSKGSTTTGPNPVKQSSTTRRSARPVRTARVAGTSKTRTTTAETELGTQEKEDTDIQPVLTARAATTSPTKQPSEKHHRRQPQPSHPPPTITQTTPSLPSSSQQQTQHHHPQQRQQHVQKHQSQHQPQSQTHPPLPSKGQPRVATPETRPRPSVSNEPKARDESAMPGHSTTGVNRLDAVGTSHVDEVDGGEKDFAISVASGGGSAGAHFPGSLDEYRQACLRLEKARHARIYDAERLYLYHSRTIRNSYEFDVRVAEDEFDQQRRVIAFHMLRENMEKMKRVEEELRCRIVRDDANGAFSRKHEMSLRGRGASSLNNNHNHNGSSADPGDDDAAIGSAGGGAAAAHAGSLGYGLSGYKGYNGGYGGLASIDAELPEEAVREKPVRRGKGKNEHSKLGLTQRRPQLNLELDEEEVLEDLARITGEKRTRQEPAPPPDAPTRKSKKRK